MKAVVATFIAVFLALCVPGKVESGELTPEFRASQSIDCMAKGMYYEARAESVEGIKAVGYVILNRTDKKQFADNPCGVIYQPGQFPGIRKVKISDKKTYAKVHSLAKEVYSEPDQDNTKDATYFHNVHVNPAWSHKMQRTVRYGDHIFLKARRNV